MKITGENYEIWFLDFLEGRLNEEEIQKLRLFVSNHPDLATELDAYNPTISADTSIVFPSREKLKKEKYNDSAFFETAVVAAMEGDLNTDDLQALENWLIKNPEQQKYYDELEKIKLKPNPGIIFPSKDKLKKRTTVIAVWMRFAAAAAILLLSMLLFYPEKEAKKPENQTTAASITPQQDNPDEKPTVYAKSNNPPINRENQVRSQTGASFRAKSNKQIASFHKPDESRQMDPVETLQTRSCPVNSIYPEFAELVPVKSKETTSPSNAEIKLSDFLNNKIQKLKEDKPKWYFTREEVALSGLHLFSRLSGNHLTGRKGTDGRLTSISLNTQLLAISIPVNR